MRAKGVSGLSYLYCVQGILGTGPDGKQERLYGSPHECTDRFLSIPLDPERGEGDCQLYLTKRVVWIWERPGKTDGLLTWYVAGWLSLNVEKNMVAYSASSLVRPLFVMFSPVGQEPSLVAVLKFCMHVEHEIK